MKRLAKLIAQRPGRSARFVRVQPKKKEKGSQPARDDDPLAMTNEPTQGGDEGEGSDKGLFGYIDIFVVEDEPAALEREDDAPWFRIDRIALNAITDVELTDEEVLDSTQVG